MSKFPKDTSKMSSKVKDKAKKNEKIEVCKCDEELSNLSKLHAAITEDQLSELDGYSIEQIQCKFSEIYNLMDFEVNLKHGSILDCYVSAYWYSLEECMTLKSSFILLNLIHELLKQCENGLSCEESTKVLKEFFPSNADNDVNSFEFKKIIIYISEKYDTKNSLKHM